MIGEFLKNARGERTIGQIASTSEFEKSYLSKLERGVYKPKPDKIFALAKAYSVDVNILIALMFDVKLEDFHKILGVTKVNSSNEQTILSEAQRAMLKCRLRQLLEAKEQSEEFYNSKELYKILACDSNEDTSSKIYHWFRYLSDRTFDSQLDKILSYLGVDFEKMFENMNIVISSPHEISCLKLEGVSDDELPLIVSGKILFDKLKPYSLKSLQLMSKNITEQIVSDEFISNKSAPEVIDIKAEKPLTTDKFDDDKEYKAAFEGIKPDDNTPVSHS